LVIVAGCLATVYFRALIPLFITECMIGAASAFIAPTISAIALDIVGQCRLSKRIGRAILASLRHFMFWLASPCSAFFFCLLHA
jgi:hypothetical protein